MGNTSKKIFQLITERATPARSIKDGYDFVPMFESKKSYYRIIKLFWNRTIFGPNLGAV